ncbi:hypothetical protein GCM10023331_39170 [Algivirga pacifica]|uniref:Thioredoxin domain-containing protein n=2 Tax=Algivirga pacifica TaxID=1162670 RepID=A0ABP9DKL0_9BACT
MVYMDRSVSDMNEEAKELETVLIKGHRKKLIDPFLHISLDSALALAEKEEKQVLLYVNASWCGMCRLLDKTLFQQDTVIHRLRNDVIPVKVDVDSYKGAKLNKKFNIAGYPTFLMIRPDRNVSNRNVGIIFYRKDRDDPAGLFQFIDEGYAYQGESIQVSEEELIHIQLAKEDYESVRFGVKLASHFNASREEQVQRGTGFEVGGFAHFNKKRFMFRPGVSYFSTGINEETLSSLILPVGLGYAFYKNSTFVIPSEFNVLLTPFYQYNFSGNLAGIASHNYGMRYGIDYQFGGDATLGITLSYQHYLNTSLPDQNGIHLGVYFTLPPQ